MHHFKTSLSGCQFINAEVMEWHPSELRISIYTNFEWTMYSWLERFWSSSRTNMSVELFVLCFAGILYKKGT